jgi:hypothetical protein
VLENPELASGFANPKVQAAIFDISQNPMNVMKYQEDPEVGWGNVLGAGLSRGARLEGGGPESRQTPDDARAQAAPSSPAVNPASPRPGPDPPKPPSKPRHPPPPPQVMKVLEKVTELFSPAQKGAATPSS